MSNAIEIDDDKVKFPEEPPIDVTAESETDVESGEEEDEESAGEAPLTEEEIKRQKQKELHDQQVMAGMTDSEKEEYLSKQQKQYEIAVRVDKKRYENMKKLKRWSKKVKKKVYKQQDREVKKQLKYENQKRKVKQAVEEAQDENLKRGRSVSEEDHKQYEEVLKLQAKALIADLLKECKNDLTTARVSLDKLRRDFEDEAEKFVLSPSDTSASNSSRNRYNWARVYMVNSALYHLGRPGGDSAFLAEATKMATLSADQDFPAYNSLYRRLRDDRFRKAIDTADIVEFVRWASRVVQIGYNLEKNGRLINARVVNLSLVAMLISECNFKGSPFYGSRCLKMMIDKIANAWKPEDENRQEEYIKETYEELRCIMASVPPPQAYDYHLWKTEAYYPRATFEGPDDVFGVLATCLNKRAPPFQGSDRYNQLMDAMNKVSLQE